MTGSTLLLKGPVSCRRNVQAVLSKRDNVYRRNVLSANRLDTISNA